MSDPAPMTSPADIAALIERAKEAADRVAQRAIGHDTRALISIPRQPDDVDAILVDCTSTLAAQQAEIERLRRKVGQAQTIITALNDGLATRDETIRGLEAEAKALRSTTSKHHAQTAKLGLRIEKAERAARDAALDASRCRARADAAEAHLASLGVTPARAAIEQSKEGSKP